MDQMKILLVDDSKSARYALRLQLQRHGVEVETADSAETAFDMLKGDLPDAILMDHVMPGLNGFEALEAIRSDARTAHLPIVMCTSHEDAEFAAAAERRGVVGILPKSVAPEVLPDILARLRAAVAAAASAGPPAQPRPAGPAPAAAYAGPSEAQVRRLVDERVEQRIEARLAGLLTPMLEDLRRDLSERLQDEARALIESRLAETRHRIEAQLADERIARDSARALRDLQDLEGVAARLVDDTLPDLVRSEIESERTAILGLVDQCLRELGPRGYDADPGPDRLAALDGALADKAQEAAARAAREAIEAGIDHTHRIADAMMSQVHRSLRLVYLTIALTVLAGIVAALAVHFLLR